MQCLTSSALHRTGTRLAMAEAGDTALENANFVFDKGDGGLLRIYSQLKWVKVRPHNAKVISNLKWYEILFLPHYPVTVT